MDLRFGTLNSGKQPLMAWTSSNFKLPPHRARTTAPCSSDIPLLLRTIHPRTSSGKDTPVFLLQRSKTSRPLSTKLSLIRPPWTSARTPPTQARPVRLLSPTEASGGPVSRTGLCRHHRTGSRIPSSVQHIPRPCLGGGSI